MVHEINDVAFVGVVHPEHGPGFDLWVGGGLSTNPKLASGSAPGCRCDEVPEVWAGVVAIFRDYGYRRLRTRARLKFLVADWGAEKFREVLENEYLKRTLIDGPAPDHPVAAGRPRRRPPAEGRPATTSASPPCVGRVDGSDLTKIADLAEAHGSGRLRTTAEQKMIVLDVPEDRVESLVAGREALGPVRPGRTPWRRTDGLHRHRVLQARDRRDQGPAAPR